MVVESRVFDPILKSSWGFWTDFLCRVFSSGNDIGPSGMGSILSPQPRLIFRGFGSSTYLLKNTNRATVPDSKLRPLVLTKLVYPSEIGYIQKTYM